MLSAQNFRYVSSKVSWDVTEDSHVQPNRATLCLLTIRVMCLVMRPNKPQGSNSRQRRSLLCFRTAEELLYILGIPYQQTARPAIGSESEEYRWPSFQALETLEVGRRIAGS